MPDVMKTLLLNPPSFENFDGGASSRWPATREIESYWYPVWLTYPAGMIPGSRLLDASPHKVNWRQTIEICKDYEFLVLFTSTVGLESDVKLIRKIKEANPSMKIAFVGPHGHIKPEETLNASEDIDFVTRGEFDHSVVDYAHGKPLSEIFFNVESFTIRKDRVLDLCAKFKPLKFQWSSTARVHSDYETVKAMADGGARLFIVGFESGDAQILKNIKKGATVEMGRAFMKNCRKVGIKVHGDFIIGLPGETKETIQKTIDFAKELDCETIQVSLAHAMPGTELHDTMAQQGFLKVEALADSGGHQLPHIEYPHLSKAEMMAGVNQFYDEYYFRPKVVWRIVKEALWDSHERKRLYHEATEFLKLRAERLKWVRKGGDYDKPMVSVPGTSSASGDD